MKRRE
ncbi:outer membrane transport family protein, partial [Vibrio cholerae BJG-01]